MRTPAPAEADLLAAASRTYRTAAAPGETVTLGTSAQVAGTAATAAATQRPDFKALLSSAQWAHSLQRAKNLMAARGITTPPTLAASAVTAERIVFASDEEGHAVVRRKNERGFGDSI